MHLHKYEKYWLGAGIVGLIAFLLILAFGAFYLGTHPQSHGELIDPENIEANMNFQTDNLGLTEVKEGEYVLNIVASAFNYNMGNDEEGTPVKHIEIPAGSKLLVQSTSPDVVHGLNFAGTNINMMVEPGYVSKIEVELNNPGEYTLVCNEYCGVGHHLMYGTLEVVE